MFLFDFFAMLLFFVLMILILTGYFSLCESKVLAIIQMRSGPNVCFFGIFTPITDGIKLFLKFVNFVMNVNVMMIVCIFLFWFIINLSIIFILPFGFFSILPKVFNLMIFFLIILCCDLWLAIFMGFFLVTSVYAFISCSRLLLIILSSESLSLSFVMSVFILQVNGYCNFTYILFYQITLPNVFYCGFYIFFFFLLWFFLENKKLPFDYVECESELIAGVYTELSGIFFMVSSVSEIWTMISFSMIFMCCLWGGQMLLCKLLFFLIFIILIVRVICFRLKMTDAFFLLYFLMYWIFIFFIFSQIFIICMMVN